MFYSQCLVSKKGPLGAIWVAAYFFKKLKKIQVKQTDISSSIDEILKKEIEALAYRVLGYLLLGVVRIYSKKVDYLFDDCNKMLIGVKDFVAKEKNKTVEKAMHLSEHTSCFGIVLPERFELDAFDFEILEDLHGGNVKSQEDITLKDGGWHSERTGKHSIERFDVGEYSKVTFHESYTPHSDNIELSARDIDMDVENGRSSREVNATSDILCRIEEDTVNPNEFEGHLGAFCGIKIGPEKVSSGQEERIIEKSICLVENPCDMDIDVENARSDREEDLVVVEEDTWNPNESSKDQKQGDTDREMTCVVGNEALNSSESFGVHINSSEQKEDLESDKMVEEASWEKMRHDGFYSDKYLSPEKIYGIEIHHSDDSRTNVEKEVESISNICSDLENPRIINSEVAISNQEEPCIGSGTRALQDTPSFDDWSSRVGEENSLCLVTSEATLQLSIPEASGATGLHFSIIDTPATKEGPRVSRKRKCVIDDTVVISNELMKQSIEDSSKLVTKRRKVPYTARIAWRITRLANPSRCFLDPLIPCRPLELQLLSVQAAAEPRKLETMETPKAARTSSRESMRTPTAVVDSDQMKNARETLETLRSAAVPELEVTSAIVDVDQTGNTHQPLEIPTAETMENCSEIAPETPVRESTSIRFFKSPSSTNYKSSRPAISFDEEPAMFCEDRDVETILMHDENGNLQLDSLSARTRKVGKLLEKIFESRKGGEDEETVSLFHLCKGKTRKESACLFYETLVLKSKDYLQVKQDYPYGDILLTWVARQELAC